MSIKTPIEWCDSTVNPAPCCTGCEELYPDHCYAAAMSRRFAGKNPGYPKSFTTPTLFSDRIAKAARWSDLTGKKRPDKPWLDGRPRVIFLNDMGDPFAPFKRKAWEPATHWLHDELPFIEHSPHIWMLLTKWPDRFAAFAKAAVPLPHNLWGGTSVTSPDNEWRIGELLRIDLAVRFLSLEPLLGAVDIGMSTATCECCERWPSRWVRLEGAVRSDVPHSPMVAKRGIYRASSNKHGALSVSTPSGLLGIKPGEFDCLPKIDGVFVGGESGPGARPCKIEDVRTVVGQCRAAETRCFVKQLGAYPLLTGMCDDNSMKLDGHLRVSPEPEMGGFRVHFNDPKGGDPAEWPEDLRIREFPQSLIPSPESRIPRNLVDA